MFIRPCYRKKNGKRHAYWALVESVRTAKGPRQRVVGYLGGLPEKVRRGVKRVAQRIAAEAADAMDARVGGLFPEADNSPQWVEIDARKLRAENPRGFGGPWLGMQLVKILRLDRFLADTSVRGKESVPWELTSLILILCRLLNPSSELYIAEHFYRSTALAEILGVPAEQVDDHRLYRGLDWLLDKKEALETFLKERLGTLFKLEYDILFYDITSTCFEGKMEGVAPKVVRSPGVDIRETVALTASRWSLRL